MSARVCFDTLGCLNSNIKKIKALIKFRDYFFHARCDQQASAAGLLLVSAAHDHHHESDHGRNQRGRE